MDRGYPAGPGVRLQARWQRWHDEAVAKGTPLYKDEDLGLWVMTGPRLAARGWCCGTGCRHCPYEPEEQARAGRPT